MMSNIIKLTRNSYVVSTRNISTSVICNKDKNTKQENTADAQEITNFDNLAKAWWNEEGELRALHSMNALRIPFIRDGLKNKGTLIFDELNGPTPLKNVHILDVGCGGGILSEPLAKLGAVVTGIDASEELIKIAKIHANNNKELHSEILYINGLLENLVPNTMEQFDAVVCSECLEHVIPKEQFLKSCIDVLKPEGSLFLTTINKTNLAWLLGIIGAEYIFNIVPKGTHDWNKFAHLHEVQKILEKNKCQTRAVHGLWYNILNNKWSWTTNTAINYALHAVKI